MITAIRPYTPQVRQNQPNFQRKFFDKELKELTEGNVATYNDVMVFIGTKHIKAKDGALEQARELVEKNPHNKNIESFQEIVDYLIEKSK